MKVAMITQFPADPQTPRGGVEAVSVNLARGLAQCDDIELHLVTTDPAVAETTLSQWQSVTIHRLPRQGRWMLTGAIGPGRRQIQEYVTQLAPDVVHAHDTYGLMVKGLAFPRVFTVHGFIYGDTLVSGQRFAWVRARVWRRIETAGWADQPYIISISPYVRERLGGVSSGRIYDIDNPIDEAFFHARRRQRKEVIFSAAVICPRKNTLALVEAVGQLREKGIPVELRLAGAVTDEAYGRTVKETITTRGLTDTVKLLGSLPIDQVRKELTGAGIFALVSLEENAPMGIAEAMAVGVPVVTSNRCGMPYMIQHGETGFLVDPHDSREIARRCEHLLTDATLRDAMSKKAKRLAQGRFHPAVVARKTLEVYREILSGRK
ncbi:MAG: glycosyltransferase family 4 protein [Candidatus Binatia bacterium]